jgi:hypothetical protein
LTESAIKLTRIAFGIIVVSLSHLSFAQSEGSQPPSQQDAGVTKNDEPKEANSESWSTYGAETLPRSKNAITFDIGYPWALRAGFVMPVTNSFEVRPTVGLW